jgi:hypothetical protein
MLDKRAVGVMGGVEKEGKEGNCLKEGDLM